MNQYWMESTVVLDDGAILSSKICKYGIWILFQGFHLQKSTLLKRAQVKLSVATFHQMENCLLVVAMIKRCGPRG